MTYSCAYLAGGAETLEEAQEAKLELVCKKLGLREGERVLDVGCGWGSFVIHAARRHGVRRGRDHARPSVRPSWLASGFARPAWPTGSRSAWPTTARCPTGRSTRSRASGWSSTWGRSRSTSTPGGSATLLRPGGRLLNHGIAKLKDFDTPDEGAFSERFVFPDGVPLPLSRILQALERAEFTTTHVEGLQSDYARTIDPLDRAVRRALGRRRAARRASSAPGSGGCTCAPPGRASRPAGRRSTRCSRTADGRSIAFQRRAAWSMVAFARQTWKGEA